MPEAEDPGRSGPLSPRQRAAEPARGQHRDQVPGRWRMADPQARATGPTPVAQGASGHGPGHIRHPCRGIHPRPRRRQPRAAGPAGPDRGGRADRHGHRRWRLGLRPFGAETVHWTVSGTPLTTHRCHKAITDRQGTAIIPIRRNGRLWKEDCPAARARNDTLRATRYYGRAFWKRWTGYHARSRIEAKMRCLKSFGERIMAVRRRRWSLGPVARLPATLSDQWRSNGSPPTDRPPKSTFASPS